MTTGPQSFRRRAGWRRWLWRALGLLVALVLASVAQVLLLRWVDPPVSSIMLGEKIARWQDGRSATLNQRWRPLSELSPDLALAVIAAEDQRFPQHHGFDLKAIADAWDDYRDGDRLRGGSTISQQVAKNLFLWRNRSWLRKGLEVWYTLLIESLWSKQRIIEVYLNIAEFGDGIYGAEAASDTFFRRSAADVSASQAALLAAVLPSPKRYDAGAPTLYLQGRQRWISAQMRQLGGRAYLADVLGEQAQ